MKYFNYLMALIAMSLLEFSCNHGVSPTLQKQNNNSNAKTELKTAPAKLIPSPETTINDNPVPDRIYSDVESNKMTTQDATSTTQEQESNTEEYDHITENNFHTASQEPLSTFSIDVDHASYSNVRRYIQEGLLPPKGAVRIEEMINYFDYNYTPPTNDDPFAVHTETATCPWNSKHELVQIGLQGKKIPTKDLPASNLVFLIDISGSMDEPNKLPLVKESMKLLVDQLRENDNVAIVTYAGNVGIALPSVKGSEKAVIKEAIDRLQAGGSTAGGAGIKMAYKIAEENLKSHGNNRIILATDGDFNVGQSSEDELTDLIEQERQTGIYLSVLGYGMGNYKDNKMQQLADKGNGNHNYIDNLNEAKKVLVNEFGGTLFTIAKDVKLQVEFNPDLVQAYRLVGYENRALANEDFNDDKKDAGELGSGHTVTAIYEIIPAGITDTLIRKTDDLKYQQKKQAASNKSELMNIKLRYKLPESETSKLIIYPVANSNKPWSEASENFRFSAAVAEFGMLLRGSAFLQNSSYEQTLAMAKDAEGKDEYGYRSEFVKLVKGASTLRRNNTLN